MGCVESFLISLELSMHQMLELPVREGREALGRSQFYLLFLLGSIERSLGI